MRSSNAICIFETMSNSARGIRSSFSIPYRVVRVTRQMGRLPASRKVFSLVVPLIPLMVFWDGLVSHLRTYSISELAGLIEGLRDAGHTLVEWIKETRDLLARIHVLDPDVVLVDLENPNRDVLEQMFQVSREVKRPIAMFVDQSDTAMIEASVDAGVSAYIVDGLARGRVKAVLDMTVSRFNAFSRMQAELDAARGALEERKVIDRAKSILMEQQGIEEPEAYGMLRKAAMAQNRKMVEIAESVVTAADLLKG